MEGLPYIAANIVETDPYESDTAYMGTDAGVWRAIDAGDGCHWTLFSNGLPNAMVGDLLFHAKTRVLRAATRSRGVWEVDLGEEAARDPQLYLRHSAVDTGRRYPSLEWVADPFMPGGVASWWESPDILIDSEPYWTASTADVDYVAFEEARRADPKPVRGPTRVFVQVHQRGAVAGTKVIVRLYMASADPDEIPGSIPDLPSGFWANLDKPPAGSAWTAVGPPVAFVSLQTGQPRVAGFQWLIPEGPKTDVWLLATVTADNDRLNTAELNMGTLVQNDAKCALKRVSILGRAQLIASAVTPSMTG
jgi:hypothetical protein